MVSDTADEGFPEGAVIVVNPDSWLTRANLLGQFLGDTACSPDGRRVIPDISGRPPESTVSIAGPHYWSQLLDELTDALSSAEAHEYRGARAGAAVGALPDSPARLTWTVEEAALALGISRAFAYDAVRRGEIPAIKIGRRILVPRSGLAQLLQSPEETEGDRTAQF